MDQPCKNCGYDIYELVDGHYYCLECHEVLENIVEKEIDFTENENIVFDIRTGIKQKDPKKQKEKDHVSTYTSFEEYNFILRGFVDEILQIEQIPNFKRTVLQLWITYLRYCEIAFTESNAHLPKFHAYYRRRDAEILYNKKKCPKKKPVRKRKKVMIVKDAKSVLKERRKSTKKSLKKIQKLDDDSRSGISSNTSTLSNLTLEDVEATMVHEELHIEFSEIGKAARQKQNMHHKKLGRKVKDDDNDAPCRVRGSQADLNLLLTGRTLLIIIYCALNICGSSIQIGDLIRFAREGHISYYNFRKVLPEFLEDAKLSLEQYHSLYQTSHKLLSRYAESFLCSFPDIKASLVIPNLMMLAKRYIEELNLPKIMEKYVEKLMELLPSRKIYDTVQLPNPESRAMAYILFIVKLLFGIDGYREKEISTSVKAINSKMQTFRSGVIFDFEAWREYIEYRKVILDKYYYQSIFTLNLEYERPYEHYISYINKINPVVFTDDYRNHKMTAKIKAVLNAKANTMDLVDKLIKLHDENPVEELKFNCTFTPLKDALKVILDSPIGEKLNRNNLRDFSNDSMEYFFNPNKLVAMFKEQNIELATKKSTFPKTYCFIKAERRIDPHAQESLQVSHDVMCSENKWIKQKRTLNKEMARLEEEAKVRYHTKALTKVIKNRLKIAQEIQKKEKTHDETVDYDEIVRVDDDPDFVNDLIFVHPDFNLWHRHIVAARDRIHRYKHEIDHLPKSLLWLLDAASMVLNQERDAVYEHLLLLENEFVNVYKPLELTDNRLVYSKDQTKMRLTIHRHW